MSERRRSAKVVALVRPALNQPAQTCGRTRIVPRSRGAPRACQFISGQINAAAREVFAQVAEDVRELKRDAGGLGRFIGIPEGRRRAAIPRCATHASPTVDATR